MALLASLFLEIPPFFSFLAYAALGTGIVFFFTRELPPDAGKAVVDERFADPFTIASIRIKESDLLKIRRSGKYIGWADRQRKTFVPLLPIEWQQAAIKMTDIAFEVFLIETVWASYGKQYKRYRYNHSTMKGQFQKLPSVEFPTPRKTAKIDTHATFYD